MQEIFDQFLWTKENKVITRDRHHVPGLANISHWNYKSATRPASMHFHSNIFEVHCMVSGRRIFQIQHEDGLKPYAITGSQAAVSFPGQVHGYLDNFVEPYEFYSFQLDVSDPAHMLGLDPLYSQALCRELETLQERMLSDGEQRLELGSTHIHLLRSAFNFFSYFEEQETRMGVQFLTCFCFSLKYLKPVVDHPKLDDHIQASMEYMRENYADRPSLQVLAEKAGYSLSYYKTKFKEETGMTPADFLASLRLEYAKDRLANTSQSITRISSDLNFSSPSHFSSAFRKWTSYTPREYRERSQN